MKLLPRCLPAAATAVTLALLTVPALGSAATAAPAGDGAPACTPAGRPLLPAGSPATTCCSCAATRWPPG